MVGVHWPASFVGSLCALCVLCGETFSAEVKKITYDEHVLPIFKEHCAACHNQDKARGGLNLTSYAKMREGASSGEVYRVSNVRLREADCPGAVRPLR